MFRTDHEQEARDPMLVHCLALEVGYKSITCAFIWTHDLSLEDPDEFILQHLLGRTAGYSHRIHISHLRTINGLLENSIYEFDAHDRTAF